MYGSRDSFKLVARSNTFLEIEGSLHKYFARGRNDSRFTFKNVIAAIDQFADEFKIDPRKLKVCNLEFGANLKLNYPASDIIDQVICFARRSPIRQFQDRKDAFFIEFELAQYFFKLYDKGKQYRAFDVENILRMESKAKKSQFLRFSNINTLADLKNHNTFSAVAAKLLQQFDKLVLTDDTINSEDLPGSEREIFNEMRNPLNWIKKDKNPSTFWRRAIQFREIITKYGKRDIYNSLKKHLHNELLELGASCS